MLTHARLLELLRYDPETGWFSWRISRGPRHAGEAADCVGPLGYVVIRLDGVLYYGQRLAWFYMTGEWPKDEVDHINMDKEDNRFANLREATPTENRQNKTVRRDNRSGLKGVGRKRDKWTARIKVGDTVMHLGTFLTPEGASLAYRWAAERYHREFARV